MNSVHLSPPAPRKRARDHRLIGLVVTVLGTAIVGYVVSLLPERAVPALAIEAAAPTGHVDLSALPDLPAVDGRQLASSSAEADSTPAPAGKNKEKARDPRADEIEQVLQAAREQIRAKRFDAAIVKLNDARALLKDNPRSYLQMATALEGKKDYDTARDFYVAAIDRDGQLADAYWGVATTSEALGELDAALGAMRSFLHVQSNADPQKLKIVQARSAIWEWESKLGRGPWGPTKGIPPGFSAAELKRDGRGVGVKIPLPETKRADGYMQYEVKAQDKFQIFKP